MFSADITTVDTRPMVGHRGAQYVEMEALGNRIAEGAGNLNAATAVWLGQIAEFDRRGGWSTPGNARSCAHWLSWRCGLGMEAAREHVRVARALEELPLLRAEMATGRLSYSKIRALTRVANPNNEPGLLNVARSSTDAQLERIVAGMRTAKKPDEDTPDPHHARSLTWKWDKDGMLDLRGRFTPEVGAVVLAALAAMAPETETGTDPDGEKHNTVRTVPAVNADSMHALAQTALDHLATARPSSSPNHTVNIHVTLEDLLPQPRCDAHGCTGERDVTDTGPRIENGPALHPETLQRILCDSAAVIVAHHTKGRRGTSMDIGRRSRIVPYRLRRALLIRDKGCCATPGCTATRFLHAHHVIHWSRGGPTALWNLVLLCSAHHHLVHEGGWTLTADGHGGFTFHNPEGDLIEHVPAPADGNADAVTTMHHATIDDRTTIPDWYGENLDLHHVVDVLIFHEKRAAETLADVSAETPPPTGPDLN